MNENDKTAETNGSSPIICLPTPAKESPNVNSEAETSGDTTGTGGQSNNTALADPSKPAQPELPNYVFKPFADGGLFRYADHPSAAGKTVIVDSDSNVVAVTQHRAVADFLCRGAHCLADFLRAQSLVGPTLVGPQGQPISSAGPVSSDDSKR